MGRSSAAAPEDRTLPSKPSFGRLTVAALAHVAVAVLIVWAAYGFRYAAHPSGDATQSRFQYSWEHLLESPDDAAAAGLPMRTIAFAREHRLLPEAFLHGCAHVWKFSRGRGAFLNGEVTDSGRALFFPFAFAVKTPLASFGVMALACIALVRRTMVDGDLRAPSAHARTAHPPNGRVPPRAALLPLIVLLVVYWVAAIASDINIGLRHLMPTFPALFILCGAAGHWFDAERTRVTRGLRAVLLLCFAMLVAETTWWFPNYLAYFNGIISPRRAYRHLIDSSLDWGQDLPALQRAIDRRPAGEAQFLAYFGTASPRGHGVHARQIFSYPVGDRAESPPFKIVGGPQDDASLTATLQRLPDYDPRLVYPAQMDGKPASQLVKRASALHLTAGRYWISASLLQPVHYPLAYGAWNAQHEATYQRLRQIMAPLLSEARATRVFALRQFPTAEWLRIIREFEEFRFARLTAWLRQREPDDHVNYSILAYNLSAADIERAVN